MDLSVLADNYMAVIDAFMMIIGAYIGVLTFEMNKTKKIPTLFASAEELKKVKAPEKFIAKIYKPTFLFSVGLFVLGVISFVFELTFGIKWFKYVELVIFLPGFLWFISIYISAREDYIL